MFATGKKGHCFQRSREKEQVTGILPLLCTEPTAMSRCFPADSSGQAPWEQLMLCAKNPLLSFPAQEWLFYKQLILYELYLRIKDSKKIL